MEFSEKDKKLMEQADKANCIDWWMVKLLANDAESEEAKDYIKSRSRYLYSLEEYWSGLL